MSAARVAKLGSYGVRVTCASNSFFRGAMVQVEFITRLIYNSIAVDYDCNTEAACIGRQTEAKN